MKKLALMAFLVAVLVSSPDIAKAQYYCAETEFYNSCVYCDGELFTGAAWETTFWECIPCTNTCPSDIAPQSTSSGASPSTDAARCGLSWGEFALKARSAERTGETPEIRYVRVQIDEDFLRSLADSAPLIANHLVTQDGYIRLDRQAPSLSSLNEEPAMISSFEITPGMVRWLIDHRDQILTREGRKSLNPPRATRLDDGLAQAVYTNFEAIDDTTALATIRSTRVRLPEGNSSEPAVVAQDVLELELRTGSVSRIPDEIRPVLGDALPGRQISAQIRTHSLH